MNQKQTKYESPIRLAELKPVETLRKIGLQDNHIVCDIGAGSGIFTIPAANFTNNTVYALEINDEMLEIIQRKAQSEGITNIKPIKVKNDHFDMEKDSVDIVLMVTVLHEINNNSVILKEVNKILKDDGKFVIIEFHKRETPMGSPTAHRIDKIEVEVMLRNRDFTVLDNFDLGDNFYCLVCMKDKN